jgi:hypothetical protein
VRLRDAEAAQAEGTAPVEPQEELGVPELGGVRPAEQEDALVVVRRLEDEAGREVGQELVAQPVPPAAARQQPHPVGRPVGPEELQGRPVVDQLVERAGHQHELRLVAGRAPGPARGDRAPGDAAEQLGPHAVHDPRDVPLGGGGDEALDLVRQVRERRGRAARAGDRPEAQLGRGAARGEGADEAGEDGLHAAPGHARDEDVPELAPVGEPGRAVREHPQRDQGERVRDAVRWGREDGCEARPAEPQEDVAIGRRRDRGHAARPRADLPGQVLQPLPLAQAGAQDERHLARAEVGEEDRHLGEAPLGEEAQDPRGDDGKGSVVSEQVGRLRVAHRGIDPVDRVDRDDGVEGRPGRIPRLEGGRDDLDVRERGELVTRKRGKSLPELDAHDLEATLGQRERRLAGSAANLDDACART